ncbi:hypothethical protein (plasmid) [Ralstonia solanacearum CMR15]|nr:hypothethical protein [Ralstonia solanacearum CMR15]
MPLPIRYINLFRNGIPKQSVARTSASP